MAPASNGISPVPPYLRITSFKIIHFRIQGFHFVSLFFPEHSANNSFQTPIKRVQLSRNPATPFDGRFRLFRFRSPLLTESHLFSLPPGTKMFQFPGFALLSYFIQIIVIPITRDWVFPFGNLRVKGCSAPHRSLSQLATSFIAF